MCSNLINIEKLKKKKLFLSSKLNYNKKAFLTNKFFIYKTLIGNKLKFTHPESYEYILGLNFNKNTFFNINKSLSLLNRTLNFIREVKKNKGTILFVGTRYDLKKIVRNIGNKTNSPYVDHKWFNGLLTNWENTSISIKFYNLFFKKLKISSKKRNKIKNTFFGLKSMTQLPDVIFILDINTDYDAYKEAKLLNIPIIALIDSNISSHKIDYPIPGNSESILSIIFFANLLISSISTFNKIK